MSAYEAKNMISRARNTAGTAHANAGVDNKVAIQLLADAILQITRALDELLEG